MALVSIQIDHELLDVVKAHTDALVSFCAAVRYEADARRQAFPAPQIAAPKPAASAQGNTPEQMGFVPVNIPAPFPEANGTMPVQTGHAPAQTPAATTDTPPWMTAAAPSQTAAPEQEVTFAQISRAGAQLLSRGIDATAVLREYGIQMLTELPKEKYPAFAARLREMGAEI